MTTTAIGINFRGVDDGPLSTSEQIEKLLDQLRAQTIDSGEALTAMVYRYGEAAGGPMMEIGINGDSGYVVWNNPASRDSAISYGGDASGFVYYHFQGQQAEQEAKHEISYESVRQAVIEFQSTNGNKPTSPTWAVG